MLMDGSRDGARTETETDCGEDPRGECWAAGVGETDGGWRGGPSAGMAGRAGAGSLGSACGNDGEGVGRAGQATARKPMPRVHDGTADPGELGDGGPAAGHSNRDRNQARSA